MSRGMLFEFDMSQVQISHGMYIQIFPRTQNVQWRFGVTCQIQYGNILAPARNITHDTSKARVSFFWVGQLKPPATEPHTLGIRKLTMGGAPF